MLDINVQDLRIKHRGKTKKMFGHGKLSAKIYIITVVKNYKRYQEKTNCSNKYHFDSTFLYIFVQFFVQFVLFNFPSFFFLNWSFLVNL